MEQQHTTQSLKETPNLKRMRKEEESSLASSFSEGTVRQADSSTSGYMGSFKNKSARRNNIEAQIHFVGLGQALGSV